MFDYYDVLITPEDVANILGCGMNTRLCESAGFGRFPKEPFKSTSFKNHR